MGRNVDTQVTDRVSARYTYDVKDHEDIAVVELSVRGRRECSECECTTPVLLVEVLNLEQAEKLRAVLTKAIEERRGETYLQAIDVPYAFDNSARRHGFKP